MIGKSQFNVVWDFIKPYPSVDQTLWMHDIYHADLTPYDPDESAALRKLNADKTLPAVCAGER